VTLRRFYLRDGTVHRAPVEDRLPEVWKLAIAPPHDPFDFLAHATASGSLRVVICYRRRYAYPANFIGPHRDADYHEVPPA
jgi:hypothetical protein